MAHVIKKSKGGLALVIPDPRAQTMLIQPIFSIMDLLLSVIFRPILPLYLKGYGSNSRFYVSSESGSVHKSQRSQKWTHSILLALIGTMCHLQRHHRGQEKCDMILRLA